MSHVALTIFGANRHQRRSVVGGVDGGALTEVPPPKVAHGDAHALPGQARQASVALLPRRQPVLLEERLRRLPDQLHPRHEEPLRRQPGEVGGLAAEGHEHAGLCGRAQPLGEALEVRVRLPFVKPDLVLRPALAPEILVHGRILTTIGACRAPSPCPAAPRRGGRGRSATTAKTHSTARRAPLLLCRVAAPVTAPIPSAPPLVRLAEPHRGTAAPRGSSAVGTCGARRPPGRSCRASPGSARRGTAGCAPAPRRTWPCPPRDPRRDDR